MPLDEYHRKRRFAETPEPAGRVRRARRGPLFVVQRHAARRLHYDFRLEVDGVLVSWAVPKGPSMNPADKRLAMMTEDHPLEYADFEGVIPEGQYGAGPVMVWDRGRYEPLEIAPGKVSVRLEGTKLRGGFTLVRTGGRSANGDPRRWLLVKYRDADADPSWDIERPDLDRSVLTGRTFQEIADGRPARRRARSRARER